MDPRARRLARGDLAASLVMLALLAAAAWLHAHSPDRFVASVQEDAWLEWASFWAFALAAGAYARAGWRCRARAARTATWLLGLALFCAFVAGEEISWGQRLLASRPPAFFLERNEQQEANLHNLVDTPLRMAALQGVLLGYGVVLPLLAWPAAARRVLRRIGIAAPPPGVVPGFLAASLLYAAYPWSHTGEWVEAMMGVGFVAGALSHREPPSDATRVLILAALVGTLGLATSHATRLALPGDPERIAAARRETGALAEDLTSGRAPLRCSFHKRVYTYVRDYRATALQTGAFHALTAEGDAAERGGFFLDPWNAPYWVRYACDGDRQVLMVYSFGPNRRRDSSRTALRGDDIGVRLDPTRRPAR